MREWIRVNTSCKEVEEGRFLIAEASESPMWPTEAQYLIID
jgi:hypothetical protein